MKRVEPSDPSLLVMAGFVVIIHVALAYYWARYRLGMGIANAAIRVARFGTRLADFDRGEATTALPSPPEGITTTVIPFRTRNSG